MGRTIGIIAALVAVVIAAYLVYQGVNRWHAEKLNVAVERERVEHDYQTGLYREKIEDLQKEVALLKEDILPDERLSEAMGETADPRTEDDPQVRRGDAVRRLASFLTYLDGRDYMKPYLGETTTRDLLAAAVPKLSENAPYIVDEKKDLDSLLRNLSHFYRVLKKEQTLMVAAILRKEADIMETVLADSMIWIAGESPVEDIEDLPPPPDKKVLYDYAAYFLETIGGKGYMARRGAKIRALAGYYSVLVLDMANDQGLNVHGIDIRPHLDIALNNVRSQQGLAFKKSYIDALVQLKDKHQPL